MNSNPPQINEIATKHIDHIKEICKDKKPLVVIRCITYNHEAYLRDALEGFVMQKTDFPFVAVVHEDASKDGTPNVLREYSEKYPDIILPIFEMDNQYSQQNGVLSAIMNKACEATGAKYIAVCEGDDYWTDPLKLQKQFDALEANPDCSIALNRVLRVNRERQSLHSTIPLENHFREGIITLQEMLKEQFYLGNWTFQTSSYFYRAFLCKEVSLNKETIFKKFPYGDMPLLLTCLMAGNGYFLSETMGCYTVLSGGYNSTMKANRVQAGKNYLKVSEGLKDFNKYTHYIYDKELSRAIIRFELLGEAYSNKKFNFGLFKPKYRPFFKLAVRKFIESISPNIYSKVKSIKKKSKYIE